MIYKIPMPTRTNGVKIFKLPGEQIGIEYQTGEPHVGKMAYDSQCGILAKNITFRRPRQYYADIVADAVRQVDAALPKAGKPPIRSNDMDTMEYDDDASKVLSNLMDFLEDKLTPEQLDAVNQILASGDGETDADRIGEKSEPVGDRRGRRQAADAARRRGMSQSTQDAYLKMFPQANRLA
jgi:hypothetical protein